MVLNIRNRKLLIPFLIATGVVTLGAAAAYKQHHDSQSLDSKEASTEAGLEHSAPEREKTPLPVRVYRIGTAKTTYSSQSLTGTVKARYEHISSFRVSGKVLKRHVNVGDRVVPGSILFDLDREDYELQHKTALANVEVARASVAQSTAEEKRVNQLRRTNAVSASEYERSLSERDIAVGRLDAAEKQLQLAINQLKYCELRSDVEGTIVSVEAEAGQVVVPGMALCSIAQSGELEAVVDIPENRLMSYDPAQTQAPTIEVSFWSLPDLQVKAKLRELSPSADPITRTYRGRFTLEQPPSQIRLGMTATVHIREENAQPRFQIPSTAIVRSGTESAVWLVDCGSGKLTLAPVTMESFQGETVAVSGPLKDGDCIVSAGVQKLDASRTVRVWEIQK
jgi:multidrug efflux system membrane fusion protein